jgi:hypothetical protein
MVRLLPGGAPAAPAAAALAASDELGCLGLGSHSVRLSEVASKVLCELLRAWFCNASSDSNDSRQQEQNTKHVTQGCQTARSQYRGKNAVMIPGFSYC